MSRIAFRVDSSSVMGSGHVARCLVLAETLRKQHVDIRFLCRPLPGDLIHHIRARGFALDALSPNPDVVTSSIHADIGADDMSWRADLAATQRALTAWGDVEWLVVDHYGLDANWERPMRRLVRQTMVVDDLANRPHECDLLLDHNCGADQDERYDGLVNPGCRTLLGPKYALLPTAFDLASGRRRNRDGVVRHVLVSFGGADPTDETSKAIRALTSIGRRDLDVAVAVGGSNARPESIADLCSAHSYIHCHHNPSHMAELYAAADLAVGGGGVSMLERCAFSLPAIIESLAPNQEPGCRALAAQGGALYLGRAANTHSEQIAIALHVMLGSVELVRHMSTQAGNIVDGRGVERVIRAMFSKPIVLRPAETADCDAIWEWRNHALTRKFAKDSSEIALDAHRVWFAEVLSNASRHLLVAEDSSGKVGIVRYDVVGDTATISCFVDPARHGQGLGSRLIEAGDAWIHAEHASVRKVIAEIHSGNIASVRAFARAGYTTEWQRLVRKLGETEQ